MFGVSGAPRKWVNNLINAIKGDGWTNETIKGNATSIAALAQQLTRTILSDTFTRADGAIGSAESGQLWINVLGTAGVSSNKAVQLTSSSNTTFISSDLGVSDFEMSADITFAAGEVPSFIVRSDGTISNRIHLYVDGTNVVLRRSIAGTNTVIKTEAYAWAAGETKNLKIVVLGDNFKVYVDGVLVIDVTDANVHKNNTIIGLLWYKVSGASLSAFDNVVVKGNSFDVLEKSVPDNSLKAKEMTILVTGDSITEVNFRATKNWHSYLADWVGCSIKNDGKSGTGLIRNYNEVPGIYTRIDSWNYTYGDFDAILIMGNMNDGAIGEATFPVGSFTDTSATGSQYGALHATIQKLIAKYPNKPIGWVVSTPRAANSTYPEGHDGTAYGTDSWFEPYCQAIITVCEHYSIPYLDLYHHSGLRPWNTANNKAYFSCTTSPDGDGVHPNALGHEIMARKIYNFVVQFLSVDVDNILNAATTDYEFELGTIAPDAGLLKYSEVKARARTKYFYACSAGVFTVKDGAKHNIVAYECSGAADNTYLNNNPAWATSQTVSNPLTQYVKIALKKMDGTDFTDIEIAEMNTYFTYSTS